LVDSNDTKLKPGYRFMAVHWFEAAPLPFDSRPPTVICQRSL